MRRKMIVSVQASVSVEATVDVDEYGDFEVITHRVVGFTAPDYDPSDLATAIFDELECEREAL